jgi:hypothetical protein
MMVSSQFHDFHSSGGFSPFRPPLASEKVDARILSICPGAPSVRAHPLDLNEIGKNSEIFPTDIHRYPENKWCKRYSDDYLFLGREYNNQGAEDLVSCR